MTKAGAARPHLVLGGGGDEASSPGCVAGLAFVGVPAGVFGVFAGGGDARRRAGTASTRERAPRPTSGKADLPPLPTKSRAKVVEPEAGAGRRRSPPRPPTIRA